MIPQRGPRPATVSNPYGSRENPSTKGSDSVPGWKPTLPGSTQISNSRKHDDCFRKTWWKNSTGAEWDAQCPRRRELGNEIRVASQVCNSQGRSRLRPGLDDVEVARIHCNQG